MSFFSALLDAASGVGTAAAMYAATVCLAALAGFLARTPSRRRAARLVLRTLLRRRS